jgi:hypothetical protein
MPLTAVTEDGVCAVEGTPGEAILRRPPDATLEKLRRVNMRLAIVCVRGSVRLSSRFTEILSDDLRMFETRADARLWLGNIARKTPGHS